jgi:hypothetical protein
MDEIFYKDLLEKAIAASNSNPAFIKTKGFFKWRFYSVDEINENIKDRNERILLNNEILISKNRNLETKQLLPLKKRGGNSYTRYDKIKSYPSNENTENKRSDIFLINELTKSNVFYAIHAGFGGTSRYKFILTEDNKVEFINNKMILIR